VRRYLCVLQLNNDKKVSQEEFSRFMDTLLKVTFDRIDANKNQKIGKVELWSALKFMQTRRRSARWC
jgi:hypothetical protein